MRLGVIADDAQQQWFITKFSAQPIAIILIEDPIYLDEFLPLDALFILKENCYSRDEIKKFNGDIFFNEVIQTLSGLKLTKNFHRFNGWNTFLERDRIEVCSNNQPAAVKVLALLKWAPVFCPDVPGFISARVVAMIINEAYFALGENISSTTDIDLALKLGTNYPYGPFEWAEKIGLLKIHKLLTALSDSSERYLIAPALNKALAKPTLN